MIYKSLLYYKNILLVSEVTYILYIEASLPKQQLVECPILWFNSVAKHYLHRRRSLFYITACLAPPPNSYM